MNKTKSDDNGESNRAVKKHESGYGYETGYSTYYPSSPSPSLTNHQPLPGQPPLPPMPPPTAALPPLPHVFSSMTQVTQMQTWGHATPAWQWITPGQASALVAQSTRDLTSNAARTNYARRDRFSHNRNNVYPQRTNNFPRKNRKSRFDQPSFEAPSSYFGQSLAAGLNLDWQRAGFAGQNDALLNHMSASMSGNTDRQDLGELEVKIVSDLGGKKNKPRKPMSQNYPSRPWNREDAEKALQVENEYNKTVRAQSLIIKFPDPDINKDIVRDFHPGIQNIHFQSPSGPRYCFVQMEESVDIEDAIRQLEQIPFGVGYLKVERKSLRDEDFPVPEEIDPYTLYVGNLPESVNVNEVKSKFPSATRVDVGYAQKMRNTRYAFIRYTSVEESVQAYKKAHDLMWDTRSVIVRFRRQRGNTCLPGEPRGGKKVKEEPNDSSVKEERAACNGNQSSHQEPNKDSDQSMKTTASQVDSAPVLSRDPRLAGGRHARLINPTQTTPQNLILAEAPIPPVPPATPICSEDTLITAIKAEPVDYEEMEMSYMPLDDDDDDDDDDDEADHLDDSNDDMDENDNDPDDLEPHDDLPHFRHQQQDEKRDDPPDHLDQMFNELESTVDDIEL